MNVQMNVLFIGGGNMADALIGGLLKNGFKPAQLRAVEVSGEARRRLADRHGIACVDAPQKAAREGDVVVFAVKPQHMQEAARFSGLKPNANLVVSIAAGIPLPLLSRWLASPQSPSQPPYTRLVRAMPNTPALIGAGVTGLYAMPGVGESERRQAEVILGAVGATVWIPDEAQMDTVTAISGSGPAYVFWFIEQLATAGETLGLAPEAARTLAMQTVLGAAKLAAQSAETPAMLRERVTSKGGTTEAALKAFSEQKLAERFMRAIEAAKERGAALARELGGS
jgi:pyrroline-5-carboxylate reductase